MIIVLARGTTEEQANEVIGALRGYGVMARLVRDGDEPLLHLFDGPTRSARSVLGFECVVGLLPTSGPRIRRQGRRFYPYHFINWSSAVLLMLGLLVVMSGFLPPGGTLEINEQATLTELETPWYLRAPTNFFALFAGRPAWIGWVCFVALLGLGFIVPLIDRFTRRWIRGKWPLKLVGLIALFAWLALSLKGLVY